tara:strand:- start:269 stop:1198 length:930 start_codon:yes stop_codon:yes gene_type:complete
MKPASLLSRLRALDATTHAHKYTGFVVGGRCVGQVQRSLVQLLLSCSGQHGPCFEEDGGGALSLVDRTHPTATHRTTAMRVATQALIDNALIKKEHGDLFPIAARWNAEQLCVVDRNAAPYFGVTSIGVHLHCYCRTEEGSLQLWVAQRALDKSTYPGLWDPTVAGGQPANLGLRENMVKEAGEEAGLDAALAERAVSTGVLSQMTSKADGSCLKQSLYFVWEMEVEADWEPSAADGEVARFERWDMARLETEVREGELLRPAMNLVMTDFLLRHGVITPDNEPDYEQLILAMHQPRLVLAPSVELEPK